MEKMLNSLFDFFEYTKKLWKSSKFLRITSIVTASFASSLLARNIFIRAQRKYLNLPPGPIRLPFIGAAFAILNPKWLESMMKYGDIASLDIGTDRCILINNPDLAKKYYSSPGTIDMPSLYVNETCFVLSNGKRWSEGRRIIHSNLMTSMKATYVEDVTKKFIKTKLFPIFDEDIFNNKITDVKPLFRPIGFNIVLLSCFGTELKSLSDPFWIKFDRETTKSAEKTELVEMILLIFGNNKFSKYIQKMLTGSTFWTVFDSLIDLLDDYANNIKSNAIKTNGPGLFENYIKDYINDDKSEFTRKDLLGDMMVMFFAATDTTYSSLTSALLLAAKYPDIQEKLHNEIVSAFGNNVDNILLHNGGIFKMHLLRAFIHETLRLFPPSTIPGYREFNGKSIKILDYEVPNKTITMINVCGINKTAKYWIKDYDIKKHYNIDMNKVNLDFWLDNNGKFSKKKNSKSFFAFHTGKRDCIGQTLAIKEMIIVLAMIFMKYKIESKYDDAKTDFEIGSKFGGVVNEPYNTEIRLKKR